MYKHIPLRILADFADAVDFVDLNVEVVGLAVAGVVAAAVGVAAADRTNSGIPFVLLFHTDLDHLVEDAAVAADEDGGGCNGRWRDSKTSTAPVFGRAVLIHYCIS